MKIKSFCRLEVAKHGRSARRMDFAKVLNDGVSKFVEEPRNLFFFNYKQEFLGLTNGNIRSEFDKVT